MARRGVFMALILAGAISTATAQQSQATRPEASHFATVLVLPSKTLDASSCVADQMFQTNIATPFGLGTETIKTGAMLKGRVLTCTRDSKLHLQNAVLILDTLALKDGRNLLVESVLQAIGPKLSDVLRQAENSAAPDISSRATDEDNADAASATIEALQRQRNIAGLLNATSHGVVGMRNLKFENAVTSSEVLWTFAAEHGELKIPAESQLVVRFRLKQSRPRTEAPKNSGDPR